MSLGLLVPLVLGIVTVFQAAINRRIAAYWGLLPAALLNALIFAVLSALCLLWARTGRGPFSGWVLPVSLAQARAVWLLPGVFGFAIVVGLPWSLGRIGALSTFVVLVAAQLVASIGWDHFVEHVPATLTRGLGALLAVVGALLVTLR